MVVGQEFCCHNSLIQFNNWQFTSPSVFHQQLGLHYFLGFDVTLDLFLMSRTKYARDIFAQALFLEYCKLVPPFSGILLCCSLIGAQQDLTITGPHLPHYVFFFCERVHACSS
ncbi:hypothetical protein DKX38_006150 [Salix brachista]|uniref:Uncharacterized protein n=1 Tax=Salix brachista TaxID=2182728 RepID=A0A5N5N3H3_9ROSI|nr:hypothetical protein DKX38_006150 [Salix brachista]